MSARRRPSAPAGPETRTGWYKDAIIYELHVRAFADSDGDGIGDFPGLTSRLDYLADLGVTAVWLLPFYPSPLRDDGYDIAEYTSIHPSYGTLRDFKAFLREAHRLGLRVITELVLNHTSDQHAWFQRARRAKPGSPARDFYVWSDTPDRYRDARIIFGDFETSNWTWDALAGAYYWHRFYSHQPDLNFENPAVREALLGVVDFWLDLGVDGMRLDAVPYLFEREGTNCENLPETHAYLRELRAHVDRRYGDRMLLAEANQWPEDAVAYFGEGDECHMSFHFPLMPRMFMALRLEDRFPIIDILEQTPEIPKDSQWAIFLRNHDELTLEMVTDEERDYMYRVYANDPQMRINLGIRRRLGPLLGNNRRQIEMLNGLLMSLPGTPVVYYGDEIGMGDNIYLGDRDAVRTPMQWSADRNAGFSRANPQKLYLPIIIDPEYHAEALNVEAQQANPHSLLWWMKRLIALRKHYTAFSRGTLRMLYPENRKVLCFIREHEDERILVVANLSRHAQYVELDLRDLEGTVPLELQGGTEFPRIGEWTYLLTLGPHAFYWFLLRAPEEGADGAAADGKLPVLTVPGGWRGITAKGSREAFERALPAYIRGRRWFGGKGRKIRTATIREVVPVGPAARGGGRAKPPAGLILLVDVEYAEGDPEIYVVPVACRSFEESEHPPGDAIARVRTRDGEQILYDATADPAFASQLLAAVAGRRRMRGGAAEIVAATTKAFRTLRGPAKDALAPRPMGAEQSNTSIAFDDRLVLKLIRRTEEGLNPDLEIGRFLTDRTSFKHVPQVAGSLELRHGRKEPMTIAVLQEYVQNEGDAWSYTLDAVGGFLEQALAHAPAELPPMPPAHPVALVEATPPDLVADLIGPHLESARLLGVRTAQMHLALASDGDDPAFAPEPFSKLYQRSLYQSMRAAVRTTLQLVKSRGESADGAAAVLGREQAILDHIGGLLDHRIEATRIRCHGDYHLGQVLWTGKDFVIIDFEGEPARPLSERRIKRSPIVDVAGMLRSFHYAAWHAATAGPLVRGEDLEAVEPWMRLWHRWVSATFLRSYLETARDAPFLPAEPRGLEILLDVFLIEKALYELRYEINNRPSWVGVPVKGILELVEEGI